MTAPPDAGKMDEEVTDAREPAARKTTDGTKRGRWHVRPAVRWIAIASCIILLPLASYSLWDYIEIHRLIAQIDAIRAKGEPVTGYQVRGGYQPLSKEQERAGDYYIAAATLALHAKATLALVPIHAWLAEAAAVAPQGSPTGTNVASASAQRADPGARPRAGPGAGAGAWAGVEAAAGVGGAVGGLRVPEKLGADLRDVVDRSKDALSLADKAGTLPFNGLPPGTELSYRSAGVLALSQVIATRTLSLSLAGRGDEALDSAITAMHLQRVMRDLPFLAPQGLYEIDGLLSLSTPSTTALRRAEAALAAQSAFESEHPVVDQLLAMRARFLEQMWQRYYGSDPTVPRAYTLPTRSLLETIARPLITHQFVRSLKVLVDIVDAARLPAPRRLPALEAIARAQAAAVPNVPGAFFQAALYTDTLTLDRCARTAIAIERYRRDHAGALPESLAQLVPHYLPAVPLDPATDAPLLYRTQAAAYTIYGVGRDEHDDGGDLTSKVRRDHELAWTLSTHRGRDVGLRVLIH